MNDKLLTRRIYLSEFFSEGLAVFALIPLLFENYGRVSPLQVGILLASWQLFTILFEIPTGLIADRYGRKWSMVAGKLARLMTFPIWLLYPSFSGLLVGIILFSVGDALMSGSLEAYSYDELKNKKQFNKIRQQTVAVHLAAYSFSGFVAFSLNANYQNLIIASIVSGAIGLIFSLWLPADREHQRHHVTVKSLLKDARYELSSRRHVLQPFIRAALMTSILVFFIEQITLFYSDTGVSATTVALLLAIGNMLTFLLLWVLHYVEAWSRRHQFALLFIPSLFFGIAMSLESTWLQIASIFIIVRCIRVAFLHTSNDLQHVLQASSRATVGSLASFFGKITASIGILFVGLLSQLSSDSRVPIYSIGTALVVFFIIIDRKTSENER